MMMESAVYSKESSAALFDLPFRKLVQLTRQFHQMNAIDEAVIFFFISFCKTTTIHFLFSKFLSIEWLVMQRLSDQKQFNENLTSKSKSFASQIFEKEKTKTHSKIPCSTRRPTHASVLWQWSRSQKSMELLAREMDEEEITAAAERTCDIWTRGAFFSARSMSATFVVRQNVVARLYSCVGCQVVSCRFNVSISPSTRSQCPLRTSFLIYMLVPPLLLLLSATFYGISPVSHTSSYIRIRCVTASTNFTAAAAATAVALFLLHFLELVRLCKFVICNGFRLETIALCFCVRETLTSGNELTIQS